MLKHNRRKILEIVNIAFKEMPNIIEARDMQNYNPKKHETLRYRIKQPYFEIMYCFNMEDGYYAKEYGIYAIYCDIENVYFNVEIEDIDEILEREK